MKKDTETAIRTILSAAEHIGHASIADLLAAVACRNSCDTSEVTDAQICEWVNEESKGGQVDMFGAASKKQSYAEFADSEIDKRFK